MKRLLINLFAAMMLLSMSGVVYAAELGWPREIESPQGLITIYQPQLETFHDNKLTARSAISFKGKNDAEPVFGAVWFSARLSTDRDERVVTLLEISVADARFPDITDDKRKYLDVAIEKSFSGKEHTMSLDRMLAALELIEKKETVAQDFNNDPPKIIYTEKPAILITLDGEPKLQQSENNNVMRVVNTPFFIVLDRPSGKYYLKLNANWVETSYLKKEWEVAATPPGYIVDMAEKEEFTDSPEQEVDMSASQPRVIIASEPTELIQSKGKPSFVPIESTGLLYMSSTESDLFMTIDSQQYYLLVSGRWYDSKSLDGGWEYIGADKLPGDFDDTALHRSL